jgi:hypothetical protein
MPITPAGMPSFTTGQPNDYAARRKYAMVLPMTTVEDIEKAIAQLPPDQLTQLRAWFDEFEAVRFDQRIEQDANAGRLDRLADEALADFRAGRAREL